MRWWFKTMDLQVVGIATLPRNSQGFFLVFVCETTTSRTSFNKNSHRRHLLTMSSGQETPRSTRPTQRSQGLLEDWDVDGIRRASSGCSVSISLIGSLMLEKRNGGRPRAKRLHSQSKSTTATLREVCETSGSASLAHGFWPNFSCDISASKVTFLILNGSSWIKPPAWGSLFLIGKEYGSGKMEKW